MDALKHIPQSFFEFFARLVPGFVAFVAWIVLFDGEKQWRLALETFTADRLSPGNVTFVACFVSLSLAYVLGQLVAPFGKGMQRVTERLASPTDKILKPTRKWFKIYLKGSDNHNETEKLEEDNYDWLRANKPELGALVAKIRAEYTMFYALCAVFLIVWAAYYALARMPISVESALLMVMAVACACRGYSAGKTCKETSRKLRVTADKRLAWWT